VPLCVLCYSENSSNAGLELSDFEEMLKHLSPIRYPAGAYVFREGDQPDGLYFITSGKVRQ
jgi:CRP-like cAMP-binding protein